jgi:hypothetical protein
MRSLLLITAFVFMTACGNKQKPVPAKPAPEPPTPTESSKAAPEPAHDEAAEKPTKAMGAKVDDTDDDADDKAKR